MLSPSIYELDQLVSQHPQHNDRYRLLVAILCAVVVHLVVLAFWKIDRSRTELFPMLTVSLNPGSDKAEPVVETIPATEIEAVKEVRKLEDQIMPEKIRKDDKLEQKSLAKIPSGFTLYSRAIEIVRDGSLPEETNYRTFSTRDFPTKQKNDPFTPVQYLPQMISQAQTLERKDQLGYHMIKRTNGFGKSVCYQQRGFSGDGNPPLWYRVPSSTCGHIK